MSISPLKRSLPNVGDGAVSGSGMDRVVERRGISHSVKIAIGAGMALLAVLLFWWFAPRAGSQTVAMDRLTISEVRTGTFEDFIPLRARVTPLLTVYIDSIEGGRVDKVLVEDGASVA
ncbi:MAG: efflux RND transporter periplasmic adaptor subunit, partial [Proteobacteria bacterium]|nr:efflux RND transporter periplasmic adaptor subunit [Pseudomonadota bacterium]